MPNYEKLYHQLVGDISETIDRLQQTLDKVEEMYLDMCEKEFPNDEDLENFEDKN